jgi:UDP-N-acetylmuramate dehydrogenase
VEISEVGKLKDIRNYNLKGHNTFGIEARCSRFLEFENDQEAMAVAEILRTTEIPYIIIGGGSNLLLTQDFEGIVVHSAIKGHYVDEDGRMVCGSG